MAKILIVDDEPDILAIARACLEIGGHNVITSEDPREVLELIVECHIDLVVLDINLPTMTGYEALDMIRSDPRCAGLPVLFLSALGGPRDRVRGLRLGANDYLPKPFDPDELVLRVDQLIGRPLQSSDVDLGTVSELEATLEERRHLTIGRYEAHEVIGRGAMGLVLRGWDPRLRRTLALKTFHPSVISGGRQLRRELSSKLLAEAVLTARFHHPNIVMVYDVDVSAEIAVIAMELVVGTSLEARFDTEGTLTLGETLRIGKLVAQGLAAAHREGVLHRDIKPSNVLLGADGSVKIADFGIAGLLAPTARVDGVCGTPGYMSPETLDGGPIGPGADLFALGVLLYRAISGVLPFAGSLKQRFEATLQSDPVPLPDHGLPVGPIWSDLIQRLLEKDPTKRLASAQQVVELLDSIEISSQDQSIRLDSGTVRREFETTESG